MRSIHLSPSRYARKNNPSVSFADSSPIRGAFLLFAAFLCLFLPRLPPFALFMMVFVVVIVVVIAAAAFLGDFVEDDA